MRHQKKIKKLSRTKSHREAMLDNMGISLFANRTIVTTESKAKELRRFADRLISIAKEDTLAARRLVAKSIKSKEVLRKLFKEIIPQFKNRNSGFTRVIKMGYRRGDSAMMSIVELLTEKPKVEKSKAGKQKAASQKGKEMVAEKEKTDKEKTSEKQ
ncbi:MAG: 50S ribosomal protein L17 [candidate division Zixibacteria bacterium]|nr:50S ribosomal protein L17 [candidate division Zixibacteria bacterium]